MESNLSLNIKLIDFLKGTEEKKSAVDFLLAQAKVDHQMS